MVQYVIRFALAWTAGSIPLAILMGRWLARADAVAVPVPHTPSKPAA